MDDPKKAKIHHVNIKLGADGMGTVELDGRPLWTRAVKLECRAGETPEVTIGLAVDEIEADVEAAVVLEDALEAR